MPSISFAAAAAWGYRALDWYPIRGYFMPLTDLAIRRAIPRKKAYKLYDEKGMYLLISTSGSKLWRLKYRFHKVERKLSLGVSGDFAQGGARQV